jgi:hypothetical protein
VDRKGTNLVATSLTRTDCLLRKVQRAIERRRGSIDQADGLHRVEVVVKFNPRTGLPQSVEYRVSEMDGEDDGLTLPP